jgi:hypothetical protein
MISSEVDGDPEELQESHKSRRCCVWDLKNDEIFGGDNSRLVSRRIDRRPE